MTEIQNLLLFYGPLALLGLGVFEEIFFFIPSSLIFVAAGFFIIAPDLTLGEAVSEAIFKVSFWATLGVVLGSMPIYWLVYFGGKPVIERLGGFFGIYWSDILWVRRRFERGYIDETVLVFLRAIPIFPISVVSAFCGLIRLGWREFFYTTFWGALMRISLLSLIGWGVGREYLQYAQSLQGLEKYGLLIILLGIAGGYFWLKKTIHDR